MSSGGTAARPMRRIGPHWKFAGGSVLLSLCYFLLRGGLQLACAPQVLHPVRRDDARQTLEQEVPLRVDEADWTAAPARKTSRIARRVPRGDGDVNIFARPRFWRGTPSAQTGKVNVFNEKRILSRDRSICGRRGRIQPRSQRSPIARHVYVGQMRGMELRGTRPPGIGD
jgi:hypothetical protein